MLVLGGLVIAFVPELPNVELDPDTIFLVFLRSGKGLLSHYVHQNGRTHTATEAAAFKKGTWICFELGPPS